MATPRHDLVIPGYGQVVDGSRVVCQVTYVLYLTVRQQGAVTIRNGDRTLNEVMQIVASGREVTLVLEQPIPDGRPAIPIRFVGRIGLPEDAMYRIEIL